MKRTVKILLFLIMMFSFLCVSQVQAFECCDNPDQQQGHDDKCTLWICKNCGAHWPSECEDFPVVTAATVTEYTTGTIDVSVKAENAYVIKVAVWTEENGQDDLAWYEIKNDTEINTYEETVSIDLTKNHTVDEDQVFHADVYFEKTTYNSVRQIISAHTVNWKSDMTPPEAPTFVGDSVRYYKYLNLSSDSSGRYFMIKANPGTDDTDGIAQTYLWVSTNGGSSWNYSTYQKVKMMWDVANEVYYYPVYVDSSEKTYTCLVRSIDTMGNWDVSESGSYKIQEVIIDNTSPVIDSPEETQLDYTKEATATLKVTAEDKNGSGIREVLWHIFDPNGIEKTESTSSVSGSEYTLILDLSKEGKYTIEPYAIDKAENVFYLSNKGVKFEVIHDTQAPSGRATIENYTTNGLLSVSATANDIDSGIKEIKYLLTDENGENEKWGLIVENATSGVVTLDLRSRGEGTYKVEVYAYDNVGNYKVIGSNSRVIYLPDSVISFDWDAVAGEEMFFEAWFQDENVITWGDGKITQYSQGQNRVKHTYTEDGKYTVCIFKNCTTKLAIANKKITSLDVSGASNLMQLYCYDNDIKTLDVSSNNKLEQLLVYGNDDLSNIKLGNIPLKELYVSPNQSVSGQNTGTRKNYIETEGNGRITYSNGVFMITPNDNGFLEDVLVNYNTIGSEHTKYEFLNTDNEVYLKAVFSNLITYQSFVANAPIVTEGMKPVKYKNGAWVETDENDIEWYNYENGKWANMRLKDGSMFVWIPRYTYKVDYEKNTIDIKWSRGKTDYTSGGYYRHPAFFLGEYLGGNPNSNASFSGRTGKINELTGFWVAKYMASEENGVIQSKEGKSPVTKYGIDEVFTKLMKMKESNAYELNQTGIFTHLTKNSEWGAVTYLTMAKGDTPRANTTGKTGGNSILQSSTKNVYGVYDLNGPVGEYVAGFLPNAISQSNGRNLNISYYKEYTDKLKKTKSRYYGLALSETEEIKILDNNVSPSENSPFFVRGSSEVGAYGYESTNGLVNGIGFRPVIALDNAYMTGELALFETEAYVESGDYLIVTVDFSVAKPWKFDLKSGETLKEKIFDFVDLQFIQTSSAEDGENYTLYQTHLNQELLEMYGSETGIIDIEDGFENQFNANEKYFLKLRVGGYVDVDHKYPVFINIKDMDSKIIIEQMRLIDENGEELKIEGIPYDKIRLNIHNPNAAVYELEEVGLISAPTRTEYDLNDSIDVEGGLLKLVYNGGLSTGTVDLTAAHIDNYDTITQTSGTKNVTMTFKGKEVKQGGEYKTFNINVSNNQKYNVTVEKEIIGVTTNESPGTVTGSGTYYNDTVVTLTAKEYNGYKFKNWESTDATLENSGKLIASFIQPQKDVNVKANFLGVISITAEVMPTTEFVKNEPFTLGPMKLIAVYADGSTREVTAETEGLRVSIDPGKILDTDSSKEDVTISYGGDEFEYTIDIVKKKYPLLLKINDIEGGKIRDTQDGIIVPNNGRMYKDEYISYDNELTYTAESNPGYEFEGWSIDVEGIIPENDLTSSTINFVMPESSVTLTANFRLLEYTIKYIATEGGYISGETEQVLRKGQDTSVVEAYSNSGYYFFGWDDGNKERMRQDKDIQEDETYTAIFYEGYTVVFYGYDNIKIGETQLVKAGENAVAPATSEVPVREGYHFSGEWSGDYTNVQNNLVIYAVYEKDSYQVTVEYDSTLGTVEGDGTYLLDTPVELVVSEVAEDYGFEKWTLYKNVNDVWVDVTNQLLPGTHSSASVVFEMPAYNVKAVPTFNCFSLLGIQVNGVVVYSYFTVGDEVTIKAAETNAKVDFNKWLEDSGLFTESESLAREIKVTLTQPGAITYINADYSVKVPIYYTFKVTAGRGGTISVTGDNVVAESSGIYKVLMGTKASVDIEVNEGYKIKELHIGDSVLEYSEIPDIFFEYVNSDFIVKAIFEEVDM